jgi:hypothetical protein
MRQIHDNLPLKGVESVIMFFSIQLLVKCDKVCVITHLIAMDACF